MFGTIRSKDFFGKRNMDVRCKLVVAIVTALTPFTAELIAQPPAPNAPPAPQRSHVKRFTRMTPPLQSHLHLVERDHKNDFRNPPEAAHPGPDLPFDLTLSWATFQFPGASRESSAEQVIPQHFDLLCYNQHPVGPTIRARPGSRVQIRLKNTLKGKPDSGHTKTSPLTSEKPHGFCSTNLHTHGLHVSPGDPADNVFRTVEPGEEWTYTYDIPPDHPSATCWYHPHKHGSVAYQLSNGLAGALIVEGPKKQEKNAPNDLVRNLEDIYEVAQAREAILILQLYNYSLDDEKIAVIDASTIYNVAPSSLGCEAVIVGDLANSEKPTLQATAVNGQIVPTIHMAPGEIQRWRIIHGSWDEIKPLTFADNNDQKTTDLRFREIACDGIATGGMGFLDDNVLEVAPGQRSDVLIQAPMLPQGATHSIYYLKQEGVAGLKSFRGVKTDPNFLVKVVVSGTPKPMSLPDPRLLARCRPYRNIEDFELSAPPKAFKDGIVLNGVDVNQTYNVNARTFYRYGTDENKSHSMQAVPIDLNTAQEWTLTSADPIVDNNTDGDPAVYPNNHTFHIHVNPFQVVRHTDANGKTRPMNLWRDTLLIRGGESYAIRSRFRDFPGTTVLHCHILDHEDQGMMVPINFIDSTRPQPGKQQLKDAKSQLPPVSLPDARGRQTDLAALRDQNLVVVFFRGASCSHCTEQLRELLEVARRSPEFDAEIIAISSERIADEGEAMQLLKSVASDRFRLLVDAERKSFRDFGCLRDGDPKHGLFLVARSGTIVSGYVGESPFGDTSEVRRRISQLKDADN